MNANTNNNTDSKIYFSVDYKYIFEHQKIIKDLIIEKIRLNAKKRCYLKQKNYNFNELIKLDYSLNYIINRLENLKWNDFQKFTNVHKIVQCQNLCEKYNFENNKVIRSMFRKLNTNNN